jgi:hypothetical protein
VFDGFGSLSDGTADHGAQNGSFPQSLAGVGQYATGQVSKDGTVAVLKNERQLLTGNSVEIARCRHPPKDSPQTIARYLASPTQSPLERLD